MNSSDRWLLFWSLLLLIVLTVIISYFLFSGFSGKSFLHLPIGFTSEEDKDFRKVEVFFNTRDYDKSINLALDFLSEFPESRHRFRVMTILAESFFNKREYSISEKYVMKVLADPHVDINSYVDANIIFGAIYREYEKFNPVVLHYLEDAYIKADRNEKLLLSTFIGYQYLYKKEYRTALRFFNESSGEEGIIGRARVYVEEGNYPGAIQEYANYFNSYPANERYTRVKQAFLKQSFYYADFLRKKKDYDMALKYYINVVNFFPKEKEADEALVKMAEIYEENKDYKNALFYFDRALNNAVTNSDESALYNKAKIYYETKNYREAISFFREFQSRFPSSLLSDKVAEWIDIATKEISN